MLDRIGVGPLVVNKGHPLNRGRVAWYLALPGTNYGGARWYDLIGPDHGLLTNFTSSTTSGWQGTSRPGGYGQVTFDGSNDYVDMGDAPALRFTSGQGFSLGFWFKGPSASGERGLLTKGYDSVFNVDTKPWYLFRWDPNGAGTLDFFLRNTAGTNAIAATTGLTDGGWHHVVGVHDGANVLLYVDGVPKATASAGADAYGTNGARLILGTHASEYFPGPLDDVSAHGRALSASEVWSLYDLSRRGYPGVLVRAGWPAATPAAGPAFVAPRPWVSRPELILPMIEE